MRISQREARRLRKRVQELESERDSQRRRWSSFPGGTIIASAQFERDGKVVTAVMTARALRHAVVATTDSDGVVWFHAMPLPE